jgi:hypothetical protein
MPIATPTAIPSSAPIELAESTFIGHDLTPFSGLSAPRPYDHDVYDSQQLSWSTNVTSIEETESFRKAENDRYDGALTSPFIVHI